jgi:hypothetical protein
MASSEPPFDWIAAAFSDPGHRVYITVKSHLYEPVFDEQVGLWVFFGECDVSDLHGKRRTFDATNAYPVGLCDRVRHAAEFARAYYGIKIDDRVGVAAFTRWEPDRASPH